MGNLRLYDRPRSYLITQSGLENHCRRPLANAKNVHLSAMTDIDQMGRSDIGQIGDDYAV
jgi:hypothetical protein